MVKLLDNMQNLKLNRKFLPLAILIIATFLFIIFFYLIKQNDNISKPTEIENPTNNPESEQIITLLPDSIEPEQKPSSNSSPARTTYTPGRAEAIKQVSPKQAEIEASVKKPIKYRTLALPNDPKYPSQWSLSSINSPTTWTQTTGDEVVIAVIDTGFALSHEDLISSWYLNPGENGMSEPTDLACWTGLSADRSKDSCDNDANGYIDDWRGWNFSGSYQPGTEPCNATGAFIPNNNPMAANSGTDLLYQEQKNCFGVDYGDPFSAMSHGTSVAGLAGATTNNSIGISTTNWHAKIMPLQAMLDNGEGWSPDIISAIYYATDNGADIINLSIGAADYDIDTKAAIDYAVAHNVIVVAAAGNCGAISSACPANRIGKIDYPGAYGNVIAVGAVDSSNNRTSFSSFGPEIDLVAPGSGSIISTTVGRPAGADGRPSVDKSTFNYTSSYSSYLYGTSFASPIAANAISIIKSVHPDYDVAEVIALANGTSKKVAPMNSNFFTAAYGHGVLNVDELTVVAKSLTTSGETNPSLIQIGGETAEHRFTANSNLASSCKTTPNSYCSVQIKGSEGIERFLPYSVTSSTGFTSWNWSAQSLLGDNFYEIKAVQGSRLSNSPYTISNK